MNSNDERRKFSSDVFVEAWSRGLNPDRATDCADDCYYGGRSASECVDGYARQVNRQRAARIEQEQSEEQAYYEEMERQHYAQLEEEQSAEERSGGGE